MSLVFFTAVMAATRATASTSPLARACERIRGTGWGVEKATCPIARAERGVLGLMVMGIRWTSDLEVRWGREVGWTDGFGETVLEVGVFGIESGFGG